MKRFKNKIRILLFGLLGLMPFTLAFSQTVIDGGSWKTGTPMNNLRAAPIAASVGGKIYAIGGMFDWDQAVQNIEVYDPATKKWTVKGPMLKPRWGHAAAVLNNKIYTIGGYFGGGHYASEVEEYDPTTDTWRVRAALPVAQVSPAAAALNGKIYAFGGGNSDRKGLYEYDPAANKWTPRAHMNKARYGLAGVALNGKLYAIGGATNDSDNETWSSVEEYDPATNTWKMIAPMSMKRCFLSAIAFNGKIYVMGGRSSFIDESTNLSSVEEYDPATNKWRIVVPMPTARVGLTTAILNNKIHTIGGYNGEFLKVVEEFQPPQDCSLTPPLLSALISSKTGSQSARQWKITLTSTCFADEAQIDGLTLTQTFGAACTPIITSPTTFPLKVGDIEAHGEASGAVTINFSECANNARFSAKVTFSANDGTVHGSKTLNNQYR